MGSKDSFTANTTSFEFTWPEGITGVERLLLVQNGSLQRMLSALFSKPMQAEVVSTESILASANADEDVERSVTPEVEGAGVLTQKREINLLCEGKVVCHAKSTVRASSPKAIDLLQQGFFLGQVMRSMQHIPEFSLQNVNLWETDGCDCLVPCDHVDRDSHDNTDSDAGGSDFSGTSTRSKMSRRYLVKVDGMECDIEEFFPDRSLFNIGM